MNREKVVFAFFIVLALTLNVGFVVGDVDNPGHHEVIELFLAIVVSLICTVLKFGDRSHIGALMLATSLVADLQSRADICRGHHRRCHGQHCLVRCRRAGGQCYLGRAASD